MLQTKLERMDVPRIRFSYYVTSYPLQLAALSVKVKTFEELSNMISICKAYKPEKAIFNPLFKIFIIVKDETNFNEKVHTWKNLCSYRKT